jgi:hypothetical protein
MPVRAGNRGLLRCRKPGLSRAPAGSVHSTCTHSPYTILVSRIQFAESQFFILSLGGIEHSSVDASRPAAATAAAAAATATAAAAAAD